MQKWVFRFLVVGLVGSMGVAVSAVGSPATVGGTYGAAVEPTVVEFDDPDADLPECIDVEMGEIRGDLQTEDTDLLGLDDLTITDSVLSVEMTNFETVDQAGAPDGVASFDWESNIPVSAVFVKAGDGGLLYSYSPQLTEDTDLRSDLAEIDYIQFCYELPAVRTPAPALSPAPVPTAVPSPTAPPSAPDPVPTADPSPSPVPPPVMPDATPDPTPDPTTVPPTTTPDPYTIIS